MIYKSKVFVNDRLEKGESKEEMQGIENESKLVPGLGTSL